ncbi:tetratricopeptide repeat protein [Microcoleus sp. Pol12A5]|uniref:tetratricopeptide repeat protein n=1 Tax=Microcoleus sp. Pol12A5 TaxID=3055392 RepID=UPI002FD5AAE6
MILCDTGLGDVWLGKGMVEKAIEFYQNAIELNPDLAKVYDKLSDSLAKVGRPNEASVCYRRALELKAKVSSLPNNARSAEKLV